VAPDSSPGTTTVCVRSGYLPPLLPLDWPVVPLTPIIRESSFHVPVVPAHGR
jgi:hypothetical protein